MFAFQHLGAEAICAPIHPENVASIHVAEKLGMKRHQLIDVYGNGTMLENYRLTSEAWKAGVANSVADIELLF